MQMPFPTKQTALLTWDTGASLGLEVGIFLPHGQQEPHFLFKIFPKFWWV